MGTTTVDAGLSLVLDDGLGLDSTSIAIANVSGNTLTWALGPMLPLQNILLSVYCTQSAGDTLGSPVTTTATITPITGDLVPEDNSATTNNQVVGSFDPNDILVDPATIDVVLLDDAVLDYTIRFQNTGTDTAFTVGIENILPPHTRWTSFEVLGSSHPMTLMYYDFDHKLHFQFDQILLPDSNTNELMSHGYVRYRIRPRNDLVVGDSILNAAAIFFDLNAPVITNTAITVIETASQIAVANSLRRASISPNPTTGAVRLNLNAVFVGAELRVTDAVGRVVLMDRTGSTGQQIDLSALPQGVYLITLRSKEDSWSARVIKQ